MLIRLGFHGISNRHGSKDFGRDYVFSERNALGPSRHLLALAEHAERISQPVQAERLLTRVRQCFLASYTLPNSPDEVRSLSAIYLFNTGRVADEVAAHVRRIAGQNHGRQRAFSRRPAARLAGRSLVATAGCRRPCPSRSPDRAVAAERAYLVCAAPGHRLRKRSSTWDMRGGLLHGLEDFLTRPVLPEQIPPVEVATLWQRAKTIQAIAMRGYLTFAPRPREPRI